MPQLPKSLTRASIILCLLSLGCGGSTLPAVPGRPDADVTAMDAPAAETGPAGLDASDAVAPDVPAEVAPADVGDVGDAPADAAPDAAVDVALGDAHPRYDGAPTTPPALAGWTLVWSDEFEEAAIDESAWNILDTPGTKANAELQYYTPRKNDELGANVYLENGALVIEAREEAWVGYAYTSARLNTQLGMEQFEYGRFEARAKMPNVTGMWPAFWMLGVDSPTARWPTDGEIDIMEGKGRLPSWVAGSLHRGSIPGAADDIVSTTSYTLPTGNFHDDWHVFAVEWDMQHVSWFVDDKLYETAMRPTSTTAPWPFDQKFYILLNLAVGGLFDANAKPPAGMPPQQLLVDYVRVYQKP
jgi:beta-glucanase (GH16 family)